MRLPAYPEIGRRINVSQGRGVNAPLSANAFISSRDRRCERSEAIQENIKRARDSWIATSAFGLLAMTIQSIRRLSNNPRAYSRQVCSRVAPLERMCAE
jgi:hypothetical protein